MIEKLTGTELIRDCMTEERIRNLGPKLMEPALPDTHESPILAHIIMLLRVVEGRTIPDEVREAIMSLTGDEEKKKTLERKIFSWNKEARRGLPYQFNTYKGEVMLDFMTAIPQSCGDASTEKDREELLEDVFIQSLKHLSSKVTNG